MINHQFISNAKKIFIKAPSRVDTFKTMAPGIPLPPQPILLRWGTWLTAAFYYCEHFPIIQAIINQFDKEDAISIAKCQKLLSEGTLKNKLIYIKPNFSSLPVAITKLETSGLALTESINVVATVKNIIRKSPSEIGKNINLKFDNVLNKNKGFDQIKK